MLLARTLGWDVDAEARIGWSLFLGVEYVKIGRGASVGHFNVFRGLSRLEVHDGAVIGQWNWATAAPSFSRLDPLSGALIVGAESAVTSRHYLDCAGGIAIGEFSLVAGVRTTVLTHQIDVSRSVQTTKGVVIGDYSVVAARCAIAPGGAVPDRSVIAMGSVVAGPLEKPGTLYAGNPARPKRAVDSGAFFDRTAGPVGT